VINEAVFKNIQLENKEIFNRYLQVYKIETSELTFTNIFMWRKYYGFKFAIIHDFLCIIASGDNNRGGTPFAFPPIGQYEDIERFSLVFDELKRYFFQNNIKPRFNRVPGNQLKYFYQLSPQEVILDRDNSDYIYNIKDLTYLRGKRYHAKRNHINAFKLKHKFEYVKITSNQHVTRCAKLNEDLYNVKVSPTSYEDKWVIEELLENYNKLDCVGALIKVDGQYAAFTIGEQINETTAVVHVEKADRTIRGLYELIKQQFCEHEWQHLEYINKEQDLGIEGLRKAKLSYCPVKMLDKHIITF